LPRRQPEVKLAFLVALALAKDEQVVGPGQFSQQWCEFWLIAVRLEELHHAPEIPARKAPGGRHGVRTQLVFKDQRG
jgi:hypothetical protein